jgi:hypothetical protein
MPTQSEQATGVQNTKYNLVSVLYHMLNGAATYDQYIQDAEQSGDQELAQFLQNVKKQNAECAHKAQELLAQRIK